MFVNSGGSPAPADQRLYYLFHPSSLRLHNFLRWRQWAVTLLLGLLMAVSGMAGGIVPPFSFGASDSDTDLVEPGRPEWELHLIRQALTGGFSAWAEHAARELLSSPGLPESLYKEAFWMLGSSFLAQAKWAELREWLDSLPGQDAPDPRIGLRRAILFYNSGDWGQSEVILSQFGRSDLPAEELAWYDFLRALLHLRRGNLAEAEGFFRQARDSAVSDVQRSSFVLRQFQAQLALGEVSETLAGRLRQQMQNLQGRRTGFQAAQQYAVVLVELGRRDEAVAVLLNQLALIPPGEADLRDQTLLLIGLVAGPLTSTGSNAFRQLVMSGADPTLRKSALPMLAPPPGDTYALASDSFRRLLEELIGRGEEEVLLEDALAYQAQLSLFERRYEEADLLAQSLLQRFPASEWRERMLGVLISSAWERQRFRTAASFLERMATEASRMEERVILTVFRADALFRAALQGGGSGEFRSAALVYAQALRLGVDTEARSQILFQQVNSLIRAGMLREAANILDEDDWKASTASGYRWKAEWNLSLALQQAGAPRLAYERALTISDVAGVSHELQLRFLWLRARLSLDSDEPERTPDWVAAVAAFILGEGAGLLNPSLAREVASNGQLLLAQSHLMRGDVETGLRELDLLRQDHPGSRAALFSYLVEARFYLSTNRPVEAQRLYLFLADNHAGSEYAPVALFEAALSAERRAQDAFLTEANQLLERLAREYPDNDYLFYARLRQADLLRKLNQFGAAEQIYEFLENQFSGRPDRYLATLSLADTLFAQAGQSPVKLEQAISRYERILDLPGVPLEMRLEAGYKAGFARQTQGRTQLAHGHFLTVRQLAASDQVRLESLGLRGRYWLSRTLLRQGELLEEEKNFDLARETYALILQFGLPGPSLAEQRLARLGLTSISL